MLIATLPRRFTALAVQPVAVAYTRWCPPKPGRGLSPSREAIPARVSGLVAPILSILLLVLGRFDKFLHHKSILSAKPIPAPQLGLLTLLCLGALIAKRGSYSNNSTLLPSALCIVG